MRMFPILAAGLLLAPAAHAAPAPKLYAGQCTACHGPAGAGMAGAFPRLAGRVDKIAATPQGRVYLVSVVLGGMGGKIMIDGKPIMGVMPGYGFASDADIAAALNYAATLGGGKAKAFTPAEVAAVRATGAKNATQTKALRDQLAAAGKIP